MSEAYLARMYMCTCVIHIVYFVLFLQPTWLGGLGLLGQVVHGADEVEDLHHVHPRDAEPAPASRHVVRFVDAIPVKSSGKDLLHQ